MLIPRREYGGHQPKRPVAKGMTPSKNHGFAGPMKAREMSPRPMRIRAPLSMGCTFFFIKVLSCFRLEKTRIPSLFDGKRIFFFDFNLLDLDFNIGANALMVPIRICSNLFLFSQKDSCLSDK